MKPKVSVIIPVYQVEKYLRQGLQSVLNQTLKEIEIICVDDGSKDGCPEILDQAAAEDQRIQVFHNENHGYGYSVNYGFQRAEGEYLSIFEPDDLLPPNAYSILYQLAKDNNADLMKGDYCLLKKESNGELVLTPARLHSRERLYGSVHTAKDRPELFVSQIINCAGIFRRSLVQDNRITLSETPGASYQDISLFFPLMLYAKSVYFTHEAVYYYRIDNPSASTKDKGKLLIQEGEYAKAQHLLVSEGANRNMLAASWSARWRGALGTFARIDPSLYDQFMHEIRPYMIEAFRDGRLMREYCDAYQWRMIIALSKGRKQFMKAFRLANGRMKNLVRLGWRLRYDGIGQTLSFIQRKRHMKSYGLPQGGD